MWNIDTKLFKLGGYCNWKVSPSLRGFKGGICDLYLSVYGRPINGNEFFGCLVNENLAENIDDFRSSNT